MTAQSTEATARVVRSNDRYDSRLRPLKALRALRRLIANPEDNSQVFEIMRALNGRAMERGYKRLISSQRGGAQAFGHRDLAQLLNDRAFMAGLPIGSVGRAYVSFMAREKLSTQDLVRSSLEPRGFMIDIDHPYAWFGRRVRDVHDIWHVLTGYGREPLGELCLTAFSYPQTGALGWACITLGGMAALAVRPGGGAALAAIVEAWLRGLRARWLMHEDYEQLLAEPLSSARMRLRLGAPARYATLSPAFRNAFFASQVRP